MSEPSSDEQAAEPSPLREGLQTRVLAAKPTVADQTVEDVWRDLKRWLREAHQEEFLETPVSEIHQCVPRPVQKGDEVQIFGGLIGERRDEKDFKRLASSARLRRDDRAWLHFTLTYKCDRKGRVLALSAYDFELVFPAGHRPAFVRFDLNEEGHENDRRWIRCHMHPGNDDLMVPAPLMSPEELLDVLIRRMRPRQASAPRT